MIVLLLSVSILSKVIEQHLGMYYTMIFHEKQTFKRAIPCRNYRNISELQLDFSCDKVDKAGKQNKELEGFASVS